MRAGRPGFALILVLLAAAAAFALALQGATATRATALETRVLRDRAAMERDARSAAILAITGLFTAAEKTREAEALADASGDAKPDANNPAARDKKLELPPIIREVLGKQGEELDKKAKEQQEREGATQRVAEGGGLAGQSGSTGAFKTLKTTGVPASPIEFRLGDGAAAPRFRVTLRDATGQLSVNAAPEEQLRRYFAAAGVEPERAARLAAEIADWRDDDALRRDLGAEADQYALRGLAPRNDKLGTLEELLYLPSMTRELFDRVRADLTLAGDKKTHINTCSREVLLSLPGVSAEFADAAIAARRESPITDEWLDRRLPIAARNARDLIRTAPGNVIGFTIEAIGEIRARYEGLAVVGESGITSIGLRAM